MKDALDDVYKYNMSTYYLLPLIGLNKFSFGVAINFRNCYVNIQGTRLQVAVYYLLTTLKNHPHLIRTERNPSAPNYIFELPTKWNADFELYKQGKYSKFSKDAKTMIVGNSGLPYKALNNNGKLITDLRLLAMEDDLTRRNILRKKLIEYYDADIVEEAELLSPHQKVPTSTYSYS